MEYVCGNSFRVRNRNSIDVYLLFDVVGSTMPRLEFPMYAKPEHAGYSQAMLDTPTSGTLRLHLGTDAKLIASGKNVQKPCVKGKKDDPELEK